MTEDAKTTVKATYLAGTPQAGEIVVTMDGFTFSNDRANRLSLQLAWPTIIRVVASVSFRRKIRHFEVEATTGVYRFDAKDAKAILRAMRRHLRDDQLVKAKGVLSVFR